MVNARWPLLEADNLCVTFPVSGGLWRPKRVVHAVNRVTMQIFPGETLGLVGESGSGKSTLGRALLQLERVADGEVRFAGQRITHGLTSDIARLRQQSAMIFQDPYASLNPRQTVGESISEVLRVHQKVPRGQEALRVAELLTLVGLRPQQASAKPSQLSGGQCQRVGIARALAMEPRLIVADECVAALDVSDLAIVRRLCDRVAVMYLGRIVEEGPAEAVFTRPLHPYTAALVSAIPEIDPDKPLPKNLLGGEPPSPVAVPQGCAFHPRCPYAQVQCRTGAPPPTRQIADRAYACVLNLAGDETVFPLTGGSFDEAQAD
ncbi:MAG: ABC transporter ATP-binding protein [Klebsiella michiganensis]|nr:ABC transporter ATP-binding protein [Klebsiella michiganensis]